MDFIWMVFCSIIGMSPFLILLFITLYSAIKYQYEQERFAKLTGWWSEEDERGAWYRLTH